MPYYPTDEEIGQILRECAITHYRGGKVAGEVTYTHGGTADIFRGEDGQWYLTLYGANGEPIMSSSGQGHENLIDIRNLWKKYFSDFRLKDEDHLGDSN